jgi:hypothetical protein
VAIDLRAAKLGRLLNLTPEQIGDMALKNVIHLPFGFVGNNGTLFGVEPDGSGLVRTVPLRFWPMKPTSGPNISRASQCSIFVPALSI